MKWLWCFLVVFPFFPVIAQNTDRHTVLIHEFLPDPNPPRSLPNAEFIELKNVSGKDVQLRNWRISNGSTSGKITANFFLKPDSIVILVSSSGLNAYHPFGTCLILSPFPALDNDGDTLILFNEKDSIIHAIAYNTSWYRNPVKKEGGWSLEMIDDAQPCLQGMNWIASSSPAGGTPGKPNHAAGSTKDTSGPWIARAYMPDSLTIQMVMNEPMKNAFITISSPMNISSQQWIPPLFQLLTLKLSTPLPKDSLLTVSLKELADCSGNSNTNLSVTVGRFAPLINSQCVINEILFDPPPGGSDYIEIYNRSAEPIDVSQLMLASRSGNGVPSAARVISSPYPLMPGQYLVLTEDSSWVHRYYSPGHILILEMPMPALPDDEGTIVVLNTLGTVVDELRYAAAWHHPLISNPQGVSLERINPMGISMQQQSWHSAASTAGFGTPGRPNSQLIAWPDNDGRSLVPSSSIISPDQDGYQDFVLLHYALDKTGYLATIEVYTLTGAKIATVANNELCGTKGSFRWEGRNMQQTTVSLGSYIILSRFIHPDGHQMQVKTPIAVWRPLTK